MFRWRRWRAMLRRYSTAWQQVSVSALQRLDLRRGAGAQKAEIAADREEADAALGAGHGALGIGAVEPRDLAGLAAGRDDLVEGGFHRRRMRIELGGVGQADRKIRRADEQHGDAG